MKKVLIIGAGGVGRVVTHKCAQMSDVFGEVWLASRTKSKCDAISAELGGRVKTAQVDADNSGETAALIKKIGADVLINVALPYQDLTLMDACLEAGIPYIDTANYEPPEIPKFEYKWQWAYQDKFKNANLMPFSAPVRPPASQTCIAPMRKNTFSTKSTMSIFSIATRVTTDFPLPQISIPK